MEHNDEEPVGEHINKTFYSYIYKRGDFTEEQLRKVAKTKKDDNLL